MVSPDRKSQLAQQLVENELLWEILNEIENIALKEWRATTNPDLSEEREALHTKVVLLDEVRQTIRNSLTKQMG